MIGCVGWVQPHRSLQHCWWSESKQKQILKIFIYFITLTGVIMLCLNTLLVLFQLLVQFLFVFNYGFSASWIRSGVCQRPFLSERGIVWMVITIISVVNAYQQQIEYSITVNVPQTWHRRSPVQTINEKLWHSKPSSKHYNVGLRPHVVFGPTTYGPVLTGINSTASLE